MVVTKPIIVVDGRRLPQVIFKFLIEVLKYSKIKKKHNNFTKEIYQQHFFKHLPMEK